VAPPMWSTSMAPFEGGHFLYDPPRLRTSPGHPHGELALILRAPPCWAVGHPLQIACTRLPNPQHAGYSRRANKDRSFAGAIAEKAIFILELNTVTVDVHRRQPGGTMPAIRAFLVSWR
jgi:hypothetical protein